MTLTPVRYHGYAPEPRDEVLVDDEGFFTCICGNTPSYAGFQPCTEAGLPLDETRSEEVALFEGLYVCQGEGCVGVIVDARGVDFDAIFSER
ncbi:hypothetical protein ACU635_13955 [[Actinomadura] parvosata]|uniref:hypothetical protein n=1 Tax=[Actinomadura] parvosata TaxID=1955412 RepID=UPI00406D0FB4